jgi:hypothetical protein
VEWIGETLTEALEELRMVFFGASSDNLKNTFIDFEHLKTEMPA